MLLSIRRSLLLLVLASLVTASGTRAQLATVDVSDPTSPQVSYDPDPNLYAPDIPEDLTNYYLPDPVGTAGAAVSAAQAGNAIAVAAIALGAEGIITSTATYEADPYTSQEPTVVTSKP